MIQIELDFLLIDYQNLQKKKWDFNIKTMNEKDLVTFEQAKKLKELGFNWKCLYAYYGDKLEANGCKVFSLDTNGCWRIVNSFSNINSFRDAPFLYQVQDWLRVEKNIHITIDTYFPGWREGYYGFREVRYECTIIIMKEDSASREKIGNYNTYYEALNAGINEALELL